MSKQEKIVCAAFRFIFSACEEVVLTVNYEMNNHAKYLYGLDYLTGFDKGFITNKSRFVDPKEAAGICMEENSSNRDKLLVAPFLTRELKPEDLC